MFFSVYAVARSARYMIISYTSKWYSFAPESASPVVPWISKCSKGNVGRLQHYTTKITMDYLILSRISGRFDLILASHRLRANRGMISNIWNPGLNDSWHAWRNEKPSAFSHLICLFERHRILFLMNDAARIGKKHAVDNRQHKPARTTSISNQFVVRLSTFFTSTSSFHSPKCLDMLG